MEQCEREAGTRHADVVEAALLLFLTSLARPPIPVEDENVIELGPFAAVHSAEQDSFSERLLASLFNQQFPEEFTQLQLGLMLLSRIPCERIQGSLHEFESLFAGAAFRQGRQDGSQLRAVQFGGRVVLHSFEEVLHFA